MRTAFNDFFYEKRGIYGVLHVMILLLSLFLIVDISIDTFNNIPFISQTSYLKTQSGSACSSSPISYWSFPVKR